MGCFDVGEPLLRSHRLASGPYGEIAVGEGGSYDGLFFHKRRQSAVRPRRLASCFEPL